MFGLNGLLFVVESVTVYCYSLKEQPSVKHARKKRHNNDKKENKMGLNRRDDLFMMQIRIFRMAHDV